MKLITPRLVKTLLKKTSETLEGDWVLIGGALIQFLEIHERTTMDIDIVPLSQSRANEQTLNLMKLAENLQLPVEVINISAAFFLFKIKSYKDNLQVLYKGKKGVVYGPNLELFLRLKLNRLSETDLDDCLSYLQYTKKKKNVFSKKKIEAIIRAHRTQNKNKKKRLQKLLESL